MTLLAHGTPAIIAPPHPAAAAAHFLARLTTVVAILAGLAHFFGMISPVSLFWVIGAIVLALLVILVMGGIAARAIWRGGGEGLEHLVWAILWVIPVVIALVFGAIHVIGNPPLTEISTDPAEPPRFLLREPEPLPMPVIQAQIDAWPDLTGRRYASSPEEVEEALRQVISDNGWLFRGQFGTLATDGELTLLVEGRAGILLLPMRIAVRITEEGETSYVDMRSRTLVGKHDFGSNEAVISRIYDELTAQLQPSVQG